MPCSRRPWASPQQRSPPPSTTRYSSVGTGPCDRMRHDVIARTQAPVAGPAATPSPSGAPPGRRRPAGRAPAVKVLYEIATSRDLMVNLTLRELRGKYKRSVLGWSWSLLTPLATMLIFSVVFRLF